MADVLLHLPTTSAHIVIGLPCDEADVDLINFDATVNRAGKRSLTPASVKLATKALDTARSPILISTYCKPNLVTLIS